MLVFKVVQLRAFTQKMLSYSLLDPRKRRKSKKYIQTKDDRSNWFKNELKFVNDDIEVKLS